MERRRAGRETHSFAEKPLKSVDPLDANVSIEKRGGELEESEGDPSDLDEG